MRSLTKLFVAVAVLFAGIACTTDVTENLGVAVGGQTEITLSLEESRTQLGAEVDGIYPVSWCEGDAISINGIESHSITIANDGKVATFTFNGVVNYPYCIAYPATTEGKVIFAAEQNHTEGTFDNGAATMYGYAEAESGISLQHLTGVLKIGVTGDKTLTRAQISNVNRAPIAGEFAFDFAKGVATPTASSKGVIDYSFGNGVKLSSEPTYIHVAVPAGTYDELYVTLYDNEGGVMYATVNASDEKPLTAGTVRKFTNAIEYVADTTSFIIKDKESLLAWAAQAETSDGTAVMVADIDMTGEAWTSVGEGFTGTFRGNGHSIKGLTAPLFGETNAAGIIGVHLVDVDINSVNQDHTGAVATRILLADDPCVKYCSVSGKITVTRDDSPTAITYIGGVVGRSASKVEFSHLTNNAEIVVSGSHKSLKLGGVVGAIVGSISNATNLGTITYNGHCTGILYCGGVTSFCDAMQNCINGSKGDKEVAKIVFNGTHADVLAAGGIVENAGGHMVECHNYANIYYSGSSTAGVQICGLVRMNKNDNTERNYCTNHGDLIASGSATTFTLGGFETRHFNQTTYNYCHNYGDIIVKAEATTPDVYAGGLFGTFDDTGENCYIYNCSNKGNIYVYSSYVTKAYLGGLTGKHEAGQLLMAASGDSHITNANYGDILYDAKNSTAIVYAGGSTGLLCDNLTSGVTAVTSAHRISYFTNYGDITVNGECNTAQIGGFIGRYAKGTGKGTALHFSLIDSCNKGNMTVNAAVKGGDCAIGGMMGFFIHNFSTVKGNWVNEGKMTFTGSVEGARLLIGGYMAATDRALSGTNCTVYNFGDVEVTGTVDETKNYRIGGVYGQTNKTFANCHNYCNIVAVGYQHVGMLTGCDRSSTVNGTGCSVGGTIALTGDIEDETINTITLNSSNYFNYMYGALSATKWGDTPYDGCVLLTEKPNI